MIALRLSVMMFIQFFLWGAWYVTAYLYLGRLGFGGEQIGWTYSVGPIAGMISPFFVGMIADRFFATERVLGVLHLAGAAAMYGAVQVMQGENPSPTTINLLFPEANLAVDLFYRKTVQLGYTIAYADVLSFQPRTAVRDKASFTCELQSSGLVSPAA